MHNNECWNDFIYSSKEKIEEVIAWNYLSRVKRRFLKKVKGQSIRLEDQNTKSYVCHPRWNLTISFDNRKAYENFWNANVFEVKTFFYEIVRSNSIVVIFVKEEDGKVTRYIL